MNHTSPAAADRIEHMARALAGAEHANPQRAVPAWDDLTDEQRAQYKTAARRSYRAQEPALEDTATHTSPAAELRAAADKIRKLAEDATPGPWRGHDTHLGQYGYAATVLSGEGNDTDLRAWLPSMSQTPWDENRNVWADAAYIAAMHPGVGLALAAWLELAGSEATEDAAHEHIDGPGACTADTCTTLAALAVARAVLGEEQQR